MAKLENITVDELEAALEEATEKRETKRLVHSVQIS
jgi:hypothetical protein